MKKTHPRHQWRSCGCGGWICQSSPGQAEHHADYPKNILGPMDMPCACARHRKNCSKPVATRSRFCIDCHGGNHDGKVHAGKHPFAWIQATDGIKVQTACDRLSVNIANAEKRPTCKFCLSRTGRFKMAPRTGIRKPKEVVGAPD